MYILRRRKGNNQGLLAYWRREGQINNKCGTVGLFQSVCRHRHRQLIVCMCHNVNNNNNSDEMPNALMSTIQQTHDIAPTAKRWACLCARAPRTNGRSGGQSDETAMENLLLTAFPIPLHRFSSAAWRAAAAVGAAEGEEITSNALFHVCVCVRFSV